MNAKEALRIAGQMVTHPRVPLGAAAQEVIKMQDIKIEGEEFFEEGREWVAQGGSLQLIIVPHTGMYDGPTVQPIIEQLLEEPSPENCSWLVSIKNFSYWEMESDLKKENLAVGRRKFREYFPENGIFIAATRQYAQHMKFDRLPVVQQYLAKDLRDKYNNSTEYDTVDKLINQINRSTLKKVLNKLKRTDSYVPQVIASFIEGTRGRAGGLVPAETGAESLLAKEHVKALCIRIDGAEQIADKDNEKPSIIPNTRQSLTINIRKPINHQELQEFASQFIWRITPLKFTLSDALVLYAAGEDMPVRRPGIDPYGAYSQSHLVQNNSAVIYESSLIEA